MNLKTPAESLEFWHTFSPTQAKGSSNALLVPQLASYVVTPVFPP